MSTPEHGTYNRRKNYRCDCEPCLAAGREYTNLRYRLMAYGQWNPFTDAGPAREHVFALDAAGISYRQVAIAAGISESTVSRLVFSDPPVKRIRVDSSVKILAVAASRDVIQGTVPIDATGTRRRLQALSAVGWSGAKLAAYLDLDPTGVTRMFTAQRILARKARAVADVYDRLWNQAPPEGTQQDKAAATRARREAAAKGWPPPMAWDDDTIDDPTAAAEGAGSDWRGSLPEGDELLWLLELGETYEALAMRFETDVTSVRQARYRARKKVSA